MNDKITFCETCRKEVGYYIKTAETKSTLGNIEYTHIGKEAFCVECNSEVYVEEIEDGNLKALYDEYRKRK